MEDKITWKDYGLQKSMFEINSFGAIELLMASTNLLLIHLRVYKEISKYNPSSLVHFTKISPNMADDMWEKGTQAIKVD